MKKLLHKAESILGVDLDGDGVVGKVPPAGRPSTAQGGYSSGIPYGSPVYQPPVQPGYAQPQGLYTGPQSQPLPHARADPNIVREVRDVLPQIPQSEVEAVVIQNKNNKQAAINALLNDKNAGKKAVRATAQNVPQQYPPPQYPPPQYPPPQYPPQQYQQGPPQQQYSPPQQYQQGPPPPQVPQWGPPHPSQWSGQQPSVIPQQYHPQENSTAPLVPWSQFINFKIQEPPRRRQLGRVVPARTDLPPPRHTGRKKALLIGCNYFGTSSELRGCLNDVQSMKGLLTRRGFQVSDSTMLCLTDDQRDQRYTPTRRNIIQGMQWLVHGAQPGDILFFHYSGHGAQQVDETGVEEDGLNETIIPIDFKREGMITDDTLYQVLIEPLPAGCRLISVMDCCHSGTGLDLPLTFSKTHRQWMCDTNPCHSLGDVVLFSASADEQTAADATLHGRAGGAMTVAFVEALEKNGVITHEQLLSEISRLIRSRGYPQKAQLTSSQAFNIQRPFQFDDIVPNMNPEIGCKFKKRNKHRRRLQFPSGFTSAFLAGAVGFLAVDLALNLMSNLLF